MADSNNIEHLQAILEEDGGRFHPASIQLGDGSELSSYGISLRDYFAAKALNALIEPMMKAGFKDKIPPIKQAENMAVAAYVVADAMIAARKAGA